MTSIAGGSNMLGANAAQDMLKGNSLHRWTPRLASIRKCAILLQKQPSPPGPQTQRTHGRRQVAFVGHPGLPQLDVSPRDPRRGVEYFQKQLTTTIVNSRDLATLKRIIKQYEGNFNTYHVTALLTRCSTLVASHRLQPKDMRLLPGLLPQLLDLVGQHQAAFGARSVANVLHSLAQLQVDDRDVVSELLTRAEALMPNFAPQGLANMAWAVAKMGQTPSPRFIELWFTMSGYALTRFKPQELVNVGWVVATLRLKPPVGWVEDWQAAVARVLGVLTPQGLAMAMWTSATLTSQGTLRPGPAASTWLGCLAQEGVRKLGGMGMHSLSVVMWSCAEVGHDPEPQGVQQMLEHSQEHMVEAGARDCSTLLYALARMGYRPGRSWLAAFTARSLQLLPQFSAREISNMLWAAGVLKLQLGEVWLQQLLQRLYYSLQECNSQDLSNGLWALARLEVQLNPRWLAGFNVQAEATAHSFKAQEVANTVWAYASLGTPPPASLMDALFTGTEHRLSAFQARELSCLVWALAHLGISPTKEWERQFMQASFHKMNELGPQGLSTVIFSIAGLQLQPSPAWLYSWASAATACLPDMGPIDLGQLVLAVQKQYASMHLPKLDKLVHSALELLYSMEQQDGTYSKAAVQRLLQLKPPPQPRLLQAQGAGARGLGSSRGGEQPAGRLRAGAGGLASEEHFPVHESHQQQQQQGGQGQPLLPHQEAGMSEATWASTTSAGRDNSSSRISSSMEAGSRGSSSSSSSGGGGGLQQQAHGLGVAAAAARGALQVRRARGVIAGDGGLGAQDQVPVVTPTAAASRGQSGMSVKGADSSKPDVAAHLYSEAQQQQHDHG